MSKFRGSRADHEESLTVFTEEQVTGAGAHGFWNLDAIPIFAVDYRPADSQFVQRLNLLFQTLGPLLAIE